MLPQYLWKIKVQICDEFRTRSTFSPSVMVSVSISKPLSIREEGEDQRRLLPRRARVAAACARDVRRFLHLSTSAPAYRACDTVRLLEQSTPNKHPLSFLQICGRRKAPTLIRSITRHLAASISVAGAQR